MTKEEINIAIAGHLGVLYFYKNEHMWHVKGSGFFTSKEHAASRLPNYHGDLNAMHEAEQVLLLSEHTDTLGMNYWNALWDVCGDKWKKVKTIGHATASQRAEAFLRTLNKWKG